MTKPMMDLRALVEKSADADLLREMIGFAAERLMELEVGVRTGADYGEKSGERLAQRNGYRDRDWRVRRAENDPGDRFPAARPEVSSCASPGCAPARISPPSSSLGARSRRR